MALLFGGDERADALYLSALDSNHGVDGTGYALVDAAVDPSVEPGGDDREHGAVEEGADGEDLETIHADPPSPRTSVIWRRRW
ncbi:MAG: hypothetical protein OXH75_06010 [Acidobacteria bacterium]|nr:hypothetical protein [Acidobacteriota bacterium]